MKTHKQVIAEAAKEKAREEYGLPPTPGTEFVGVEGSSAEVGYELSPDDEKDRLSKQAYDWERAGVGKAITEHAPPLLHQMGYVSSDGTVAPWHPATGNAALMETLIRAMRDPSIDPGRMQQWAEIYERIAAKEAERQFNIAMKEAQNEMPKLVKDAKAPDYRYLTLETMGTKIDPITRKHGFSESYGTDDSPLDGHYRVTCNVSHTGGHTRLYRADIPTDTTGPKGTRTKTGVQGFGSTVSYCRRYLKTMIWNLVIINDDNDGAGDPRQFRRDFEHLGPNQVAEIEDLLNSTGRSVGRFLQFKRITSLEQIHPRDFENSKKEIMAVAKRDEPHQEINVPEVPTP